MFFCVSNTSDGVGVHRVGGGTNSSNLRTDSRGYGRRQRACLYGCRDRAAIANAVQPAHRVSSRLRPPSGRTRHASRRRIRGNGELVVRPARLRHVDLPRRDAVHRIHSQPLRH